MTDVSRPRWDKTRARWVVRWTEGGKRRAKATWTQDEQAGADAFRRELLGLGPVAPPDESKPATAGAIAQLLTSYDGSASWWDTAHGWFAAELISATHAGDAARLDILGKGARAFAPIANSQKAHRDLKQMEATLARLKARFAELTQAAKHGTRSQSATPVGGTGSGVVRRDAPLH